MAAGLSLTRSQSTPLNQGMACTSRRSATHSPTSVIKRRTVTAAAAVTATSGGNTRSSRYRRIFE